MDSDWVICPNGCGEKLFYLELHSHCRTVCRDRPEPCAFGCGDMVKYRDRDRHKMLLCLNRFVRCSYAPDCKWTGMAKHLPVHLDDQLTTAQKHSLVPEDLYIECLERPFICWHPPLLPSAETFKSSTSEGSKAYSVEWVGCGESVRFADRTRHICDTCQFRRVVCQGCGSSVIGSRMEEHLQVTSMRLLSFPTCPAPPPCTSLRPLPVLAFNSLTMGPTNTLSLAHTRHRAACGANWGRVLTRT